MIDLHKLRRRTVRCGIAIRGKSGSPRRFGVAAAEAAAVPAALRFGLGPNVPGAHAPGAILSLWSRKKNRVPSTTVQSLTIDLVGECSWSVGEIYRGALGGLGPSNYGRPQTSGCLAETVRRDGENCKHFVARQHEGLLLHLEAVAVAEVEPRICPYLPGPVLLGGAIE